MKSYEEKKVSIHLCFKDKCVWETGTVFKDGSFFCAKWKKFMIVREVNIVWDPVNTVVVLEFRLKTEKEFYTKGVGTNIIPVKMWNKFIAP